MNKIGRNSTCPCGSGQKYKKCCLPKIAMRKIRSESIFATTANEVSEISVVYDSLTGEIEFEQPVIKQFNQVSYDRQKAPKVLNRIPIGTKSLQFDSNLALLKNSDLLFAVDTNTRLINGARHSVGCFVLAEQLAESAGKRIDVKWSIPFCIDFTDLVGKPENFSWKVLMEHIQSDQDLQRIPKISVIVDSDLDNIPRYNERSLPFIGNVYLPNNVQLIYASSDSGGEYLANKMIREADKMAKLILAHIESGAVPKNTGASSYRKLFSKINPTEPRFISLRKKYL